MQTPERLYPKNNPKGQIVEKNKHSRVAVFFQNDENDFRLEELWVIPDIAS
jgi:hypothetical protein